MELLNDMLSNEFELIISSAIQAAIQRMDIDYGKIIELKSMQALQKIKAVIEDDSLSDFECVERIVRLFEEIGSNGGNRHDF